MHDRDLYGLLERTSDAAFAVTDNSDICSWNASAEALFGFQRDAVIGKTCFQLFEGHDTLGALTCTENCHVRDCAAHHAAIPDFDLEVHHINQKLGTHTRIEAVTHALRRKLI